MQAPGILKWAETEEVHLWHWVLCDEFLCLMGCRVISQELFRGPLQLQM